MSLPTRWGLSAAEMRTYIQSLRMHLLGRRVLRRGEPPSGTVSCDVTAATRAALRVKEVRAPRARRESSTISLIERAECALHERLRVVEEDPREYGSKTIPHPVRWRCGDPVPSLDGRPGARRDTVGEPGSGPADDVRSG